MLLLKLSTSGIPRIDIGSLFNTIMSDLDGGIKCALMNFADGTKLSGEVNLQKENCPGWADENLMKFSKDKCMWENMIQECSTV